MHVARFALPLALLIAVGLPAGVRSLSAQDQPAAQPQPVPLVELNELEQAFVDLMKDSALVGTFSIGGRDDREPRAERYEIKGASKLKADNWLIHARIVYGNFDVVVPVPVKMNWAGDTPMLSVTNLTIPLLGEGFTARVLFYDGRYAGTWAHGPVGGHMWGKIEKPGTDDADGASKADEPKPASK
jgi:hypothetical protein